MLEYNLIKRSTIEETNVTTTNITDERASTLIDQLTLNDPEFIQ